MNPVQKPAWLIALVFASLMSILFGLIHVSDAIVRSEIGSISGETLDATINPLYAVVYLGGVAASWNQKRIGYVVILILSSLSTWAFSATLLALLPRTLWGLVGLRGSCSASPS